jgi:hypothetical protein
MCINSRCGTRASRFDVRPPLRHSIPFFRPVLFSDVDITAPTYPRLFRQLTGVNQTALIANQATHLNTTPPTIGNELYFDHMWDRRERENAHHFVDALLEVL